MYGMQCARSTWNTTKVPHRLSHCKAGVPRETSCILTWALLDFRWRGNVVPNHCGCEPKGWGWKDYDGGKLSRLPCCRWTNYLACRLRFSGQRDCCYRVYERSRAENPLSHDDFE